MNPPVDNRYVYDFQLERVIDGDTIVGRPDLGWDVWLHQQHLRFYGVNAPELHSHAPDVRAVAQKAKAFVSNALHLANRILIQTIKDKTGKYGRMLAKIWYLDPDGNWHYLNQELVDQHLAVLDPEGVTL